MSGIFAYYWSFMLSEFHWSTYPFLGLLAIYLLTSTNSLSLRNRLMPVVNRWLRWGLFGTGFALGSIEFGWFHAHYALLLIAGLLFWFLIESIYNWFLIRMISDSPIPLFPRFNENDSGDEWPSEKTYINMRDWIRKSGFRRLQSLKSNLIDNIYVRSTIYESEDHLTRLQVLFMPSRSGRVMASLIFTSTDSDGHRIITDNVNIPYGGFYPANYFCYRHPLVSAPDKLYERHQSHVSNLAKELESFEDIKPVDDLNHQQAQLLRANTDAGFLNHPSEQEENGRISSDGRYRLWKEIWLLNYLGKTIR